MEEGLIEHIEQTLETILTSQILMRTKRYQTKHTNNPFRYSTCCLYPFDIYYYTAKEQKVNRSKVKKSIFFGTSNITLPVILIVSCLLLCYNDIRKSLLLLTGGGLLVNG